VNKALITLLVEFLPENSSYFVRNGLGRDRPSQHALALNDPKFGWNWSKSIFEDGLEIPWVIGHQPLLDASSYLRGACIESMDQVLTLAGPLNTTTRSLLKGLLISRDATLAAIADWMRLPLEVVTLYDQLFFNVRDRLDEPGYVTQVLNPDGIRLTRDTDDEELLMLRAGYQHGAREVIRLAGIKPEKTTQSNEELLRGLERETLLRATNRVRHGGDEDLDTPAVTSVMKLLVADKRVQRDQPQPHTAADALGELGEYYPVLDAIQAMNQPAIDRMLELSQEDAINRTGPAVECGNAGGGQ